MSTSRAVATKSAKDEAPASRNHKNTQAVVAEAPESQQEFAEEQFLIQRKENACPCGGGCPKCLGTLGVQAKLKIGAPNDVYEQEADRVADQVMRMPAPKEQRQPEEEEEEVIQTKPLAGQITPLVQRQKMPEEEDEEDLIQAKANPGHTPQVTPNIAANIHGLKGGGQPMPENQRRFFESRMGQDFSGVRIHTDSKAADTAQTIQAKAFTLGHDIVFNAGQYSHDSQAGKKLLAHELTHVVQQNGGASVGGKRALTPFTQSHLEVSADSDADSAMNESAVTQLSSTSVRIACQRIEDELEVVDEEKPELFPFVGYIGTPATPLNAIDHQLSRTFNLKNAAEREKGLKLAFGLLEEDHARLLHQVLTHPETKEQKKLKARFGMLRRGLRARLTNILATKARLALGQGKAKTASRKTKKPHKTNEVNLQRPGIFGTGVRGQDPYYVVREGITLAEIARYLSDDPDLVDTLVDLNEFAPEQPLKGGTQVTVPGRSATRPEAKRHIRSDLSDGLYINRRSKEKGERKRTKFRGFILPLTDHQVKVIQNNQKLKNREREYAAREQAQAPKSDAEQRRANQEQFKRDLQLFRQIQEKGSQLPFIPSYYLRDDQRWRKIKDPVLRWHARTTGKAVPSVLSAAMSPVVHFVNNGSLFIEGIIEGVRTNLSADEVNALRKRLDLNPVELAAFIPSFNVGAAAGVGEDIVDLFKTLWNIDEVLAAIDELLRVMGSYEGAEVARLMGVETGASYASKISAMANSNPASFGYNLGKLVGPAIAYTILAFLGIQVGPAVVFKKIAKLPQFQRIFSRFKKASPDVDIKPDAPTPSTPKKLESPTEQQSGGTPRTREEANAPQKLPEEIKGSDPKLKESGPIDTARPDVSPDGQLIRLVDTIRARGFNKVTALRKRLKILGRKGKGSTQFARNGAYGEFDTMSPLNGRKQAEIGVAFSRKNSPDGTLKSTGYYEQYARPVGKGTSPRIYDSEVKIFDNAREELLRTSDIESGVIRIFTERPACGSCEMVAQRFVNEFPNMRVEIYNFFTGKPLLIKSTNKL